MDSSVISYLRAFGIRWFVAMSGPLSVPLAALAYYIQNDAAKIVLFVTAIFCAIFSSYWIWKVEREARTLAEAKLKKALEGRSPLRIIFDTKNPDKKFWSLEPMKDEADKQVAGSFWEYRAMIRNDSPRTVRNVKVVVEAIGAMPTRPEFFDLNKKPIIDLNPNEETLAVIRRWPYPSRFAGMACGVDVYGPVKMVVSADDVLPTIAVFHFDPERTPMIFV
jgi:hypothetical protein